MALTPPRRKLTVLARLRNMCRSKTNPASAEDKIPLIDPPPYRSKSTGLSASARQKLHDLVLEMDEARAMGRGMQQSDIKRAIASVIRARYSKVPDGSPWYGLAMQLKAPMRIEEELELIAVHTVTQQEDEDPIPGVIETVTFYAKQHVKHGRKIQLGQDQHDDLSRRMYQAELAVQQALKPCVAEGSKSSELLPIHAMAIAKLVAAHDFKPDQTSLSLFQGKGGSWLWKCA